MPRVDLGRQWVCPYCGVVVLLQHIDRFAKAGLNAMLEKDKRAFVPTFRSTIHVIPMLSVQPPCQLSTPMSLVLSLPIAVSPCIHVIPMLSAPCQPQWLSVHHPRQPLCGQSFVNPDDHDHTPPRQMGPARTIQTNTAEA
jgi:hypothetical protein